MQGREERRPEIEGQEEDSGNAAVARELIFSLGECLASVRRGLLDAKSRLGADPGEHARTARSIDEALADNDSAYAIMMRLRWSLLRKVATNHEKLREGGTMAQDKPTIIVVDDSPSVRRALTRLLKSVGLSVRTCSSALQFLELELPDAPCCAVLDVRMPRMSGLDLQQEMAQRGIDIPVVFITGHGDIDMAVQAMKDGAIDFLPKPFNDQDLLDAIDRAVTWHRQHRREQAEAAGIQARIARLTPRERQVMERVITGMLNKQIAFELGTAEKTIKVHRARVMEKMEAVSVAELVKLAAIVGIDGPHDAGE